MLALPPRALLTPPARAGWGDSHSFAHEVSDLSSGGNYRLYGTPLECKLFTDNHRAIICSDVDGRNCPSVATCVAGSCLHNNPAARAVASLAAVAAAAVLVALF